MAISLGFFTVLGLALSSLAVSPSSTTHRIRDLEHGVRIVAYQPPSVFETYEDGIEHPSLTRSLPAEPKDIALAFLSEKTGVDPSNLFYRTGFSGQMATHAYVHQMHNDIVVANCVSNVAISQTGRIISYGSSFIKPASIASPTPFVSVQNAISVAEKHLDGSYDNWPTEIKYFALDTDHVVLTRTVQIKNSHHRYLAYVDAHSGEVVNVVDYTAQAKPPPPPPPPPTPKYQYSIVPFSYPDVTHGFALYTNPAYAGASPNGWHTPSTAYLSATTSGNNVIAFIGAITGTTKESAAGPKFQYTFDSTLSPKSGNNPAAATVNAFYTGNIIHDLAYRYGFTENAFNFQSVNYHTGGVGGDPVHLSVQDSGGTNNAFFHTMPDGQPGMCSMFLWTDTLPNRDGGLSNDIITHEFTHGISNRMIGGGSADCQQTAESWGLGEGWSDTLAFAVEQLSATPKDWVIGSWVTGSARGLRTYPYSISKDTNPLLYGALQTRTEAHDVGEVWANIMVNVFWALTAKYGFGAISDPTSTAGNVVFLHLFFDAFPVMPCNPSFVDARSAIIIADNTRYGGANWCLLWNVFASRGLGAYASNHQNNYDIPPKVGCVRNF